MFGAIPLYRRSPACSVALIYGLMAWRCTPLRGLPLALPACRRPCSPVALSAAVPCSGGAVSGPPAAASPCVALRKSRRHSRSPLCESRWQSRCESRKCLRQSRSFHPKIIVVYKIPRIKAGFFFAHFPGINGKSCKSRSVSAHFTSKLLASMYFCWSCSGVKPSICGWFGVKTISCLSTMP